MTRLQLQRRLGWEPREYTEVADRLLRTGQIGGWRFPQDVALLYLMAREIPAEGVTLEIGSYKGLATTALAFGVRDGRRAPVHTVDPHTGDRQALDAEGVAQLPSEEEFKRNIHEAGVADVVVAYTMTSDELAEQWPGGPIRLLFIDGWHSYDAVSSDIRNWVPLLSDNGVVVIDDYYNYEEVKAAVDDAAEVLPPHQRRAGRMRIAYANELPSEVARYLRVPWG